MQCTDVIVSYHCMMLLVVAVLVQQRNTNLNNINRLLPTIIFHASQLKLGYKFI